MVYFFGINGGRYEICFSVYFFIFPGTCNAVEVSEYIYYLDPVRNCSTPYLKEFCRSQENELKNTYKAAMKGEYQAQRNLSYCFSTGCMGMRKNPLIGCVWRFVIIQSGDISSDETDAMNFDLYCGSNFLSDSERALAASKALNLILQIKKLK